MTQPALDHGYIDSSGNEVDGSRVPEGVRRDALFAQVRMESLGGGHVLAEPKPHTGGV